MAKAEIHAGICGFETTVVAKKRDDGMLDLEVESGCKAVMKLAERIRTVDPYREFTWRRQGPLTLAEAPQCLSHPACPVPSGIIKVVEVEAGLALPKDVTIKISKSEE
jgi:hypothetical protein